MPSAATPVPLPERYRVEGHIADGGMGSVWAAYDEVLGRRVAIKLLAERLAEDAINRERFAREARAAARVSAHPSVVTIYDVGEHEGRPFIVMAHMPGGTIADRLRAGRPHPVDALEWLRDAAAGLDHGHEQGVVHRDVKPANLLFDEGGRVRVGDFGIARLAAEDTMTGSGQVLGTAAYLSPEQVLGGPATPASDRYALAVVAFELLTGARPYRGGPPAAQARQHVEAPPPLASERARGVSPAVDAALVRGLAKDPEDRWPSCAALVDALQEGAAGATASTTNGEPTMPITPRRPIPAQSAAAPPRATSARRTAGAPRAARASGSAPPAPGRRRRDRRAIFAVLALVTTAALLALVVVLGGGSGESEPSRASKPTTTAKSTSKSKPKSKKQVKPGSTPAPAPRSTPAPPAQTDAAPAPTNPTTTPQTSSTPAPAPAAGAAALQLRGHELVASDAAAAIPVLRRALKATGKSTDRCLRPTGACLTYAYALFDLGRALRLAGNPQAAIAVLNDRARIQNQPGTVAAELRRAQSAARRAAD